MSNNIPTTDPTLPVELRPAIGQIFTPDEIAEGCDYTIMDISAPVLLCIAPNVYVYYPAGQQKVPSVIDASFLCANGATTVGNVVRLNPGYSGPTESDGWLGDALGWPLARVLNRVATPPTNPNWGLDPQASAF